MVKEVFFFTEMGYTAYSQEVAASYGYTSLMLPNENFVPENAKQLYDMYFEEHQQAVEAGFDGVMINEHHNNPLSMMASINVIGGMLAKALPKGKIVFLGNVLPIHENPLRVAEEIAIVDVISGGRVISGFVRGVGQETFATNINPVHNRERFEEAHDLIIKAWTTPGPFRWEGQHYNLRVVNPWVLPMQKPHPPIWIPGVSSPETIEFAAQHKYPYIALPLPWSWPRAYTTSTTRQPWGQGTKTARNTGDTPSAPSWRTATRRPTKRGRSSTGSLARLSVWRPATGRRPPAT